MFLPRTIRLMFLGRSASTSISAAVLANHPNRMSPVHLVHGASLKSDCRPESLPAVIAVGELRFPVECESPGHSAVADVARKTSSQLWSPALLFVLLSLRTAAPAFESAELTLVRTRIDTERFYERP